MLAALRKCGRYVSTRKWRQEGHQPSASVIENRFGDWKAAWKRAGIDVPEVVRQPKWNRENILAKLKKVGEYVPMRVWIGPPHKSTIIALFGTWEAAWAAAGIPVREGHYNKDDLLHVLQTCGKFITSSQWIKEGRQPSVSTFSKYFGSWGSAWKAAGITVPSRSEIVKSQFQSGRKRDLQRKWTRENIVVELKRIGKFVPCDQWVGTPSMHTIFRMFGSWRAAWEAADIEVKRGKRGCRKDDATNFG